MKEEIQDKKKLKKGIKLTISTSWRHCKVVFFKLFVISLTVFENSIQANKKIKLNDKKKMFAKKKLAEIKF
jgi:hypothetical protein